ncbi:hypothetical protein HA44_20235 [Mixta gaviniae]|nr:hypothetical protein HA44_20235 [Mixta gaviniae]
MPPAPSAYIRLANSSLTCSRFLYKNDQKFKAARGQRDKNNKGHQKLQRYAAAYGCEGLF